MVLYHYTRREAAEAIVSQRLLYPSLRRNRPNDIRYGEGQYLSDISPGSITDEELALLLVGNRYEAHRLTHFVAIETQGLPIRKGRAGVFVVRGSKDLDLTGRIVGTGRNEDDLSQSTLDA